MNYDFGFHHAGSGNCLSLPTRFWCPHVPLFRFPALSLCCFNSNVTIQNCKSIQYNKRKLSRRLKFILSFHKKTSFFWRMLHWKEKESKRNPAFVWKIRTYQEQHGPLPYIAPFRHPLAMTWMASCVRKYSFPSVLVHPLVSMLRLSALVLATAAAYRGCLSL